MSLQAEVARLNPPGAFLACSGTSALDPMMMSPDDQRSKSTQQHADEGESDVLPLYGLNATNVGRS
jgi:hypothetical protein